MYAFRTSLPAVPAWQAGWLVRNALEINDFLDGSYSAS